MTEGEAIHFRILLTAGIVAAPTLGSLGQRLLAAFGNEACNFFSHAGPINAISAIANIDSTAFSSIDGESVEWRCHNGTVLLTEPEPGVKRG